MPYRLRFLVLSLPHIITAFGVFLLIFGGWRYFRGIKDGGLAIAVVGTLMVAGAQIYWSVDYCANDAQACEFLR